MAKVDLVGQLNTFLHRHLTGARVTDPSNAAFMGLYRALDLGGWDDELCAAVGASMMRETASRTNIAAESNTRAPRGHSGRALCPTGAEISMIFRAPANGHAP